MFDFDLFVLGGGSAGVRAARIAAGHGARVAIAEDRYLGGTCVNVGCIPKKLLVYASHFSEDFEDAAGFGWTVDKGSFSWPRLIANKDQEIERLNGVYRRLLEGAGARILWGRAELADAHTVRVDGAAYSAERIIVATGGWPSVPDFPGREHVVTSNEAFYLDDLPRRVIVAGGGYIAVEFAGIFHGLGAEVSQIYRGPLFLRGFDDDVRGCLAEEMTRKGVDLRFNTTIEAVTRDGDSGPLAVDFGDGTSVRADLVMCALGRHPNTANLGLEAAGIALDEAGAVIVDEAWQTSVPHIYAIGDVTDRLRLTPVAVAEGHALADALFKPSGRGVSYRDVPTAVFSAPAIGTVGLTEAEARTKFASVDVYKSSFRALKHTLSGRDESTMMKLVVDPASDRVVGIHMVGPEAGEIIQGFAVAITAGATKAVFDATIGIHPTAAEEFVTMREKYVELAEAAE